MMILNDYEGGEFMEHFGVKIVPGKYGFKLSRDKYALINRKSSFSVKLPGLDSINAYEDSEGKIYTQEWCEKHRKNALNNFDVNMNYFSQLDKDDFDTSIKRFIDRFPHFQEVTDLKAYTGKSGYYLMIMDEYKQVYIGKTTRCLCNRVKQHWNGTKSFDRLLFPINSVTGSVLSIDSFRCLDTSRLYINTNSVVLGNEDLFIRNFPKRYLLNRIGGDIDGSNPLDFFSILNSINTRPD